MLDRSKRLVTIWSVGVIKPRYSGTLERSYMSNGCCDCDALISEFYEHDAWHDEEATLGGISNHDFSALGEGNRERWVRQRRVGCLLRSNDTERKAIRHPAHWRRRPSAQRRTRRKAAQRARSAGLHDNTGQAAPVRCRAARSPLSKVMRSVRCRAASASCIRSARPVPHSAH